VLIWSVLCRPAAAAGKPAKWPELRRCRAQVAETEAGSGPAVEPESTAAVADAACKMHHSCT